MSRLYALGVGFWLASTQVAWFLALQTLATSAALTFALVTAAWLAGSLLGVWLPRAFALPAMAATAAAPYLSLGLLKLYPYDLIWLPAHALLVASAGLYAGLFFSEQRGSPAGLFLWENNGFVLGLAVGTLAAFAGSAWWLPAALGAPLLLLRLGGARRAARG